jgi:hypothetical protein
MDRVENGINAWAETKPDPNVNYAIFEQNESEESGRGYRRHKDGQKMERRRPNPATIIIVIQLLNIPHFLTPQRQPQEQREELPPSVLRQGPRT